jgi:hypothetical protein
MRSLFPESPAVIEALEPRLAPAGVITLTTTGGILTITGDGEGNSIRIEDVPGSGEWKISEPVAGTSYVLNGVTQANVPFYIPAMDGIKALLGDGDDQLEIHPSSSPSGMILSGGLSVLGGKGNDKIGFGSAGAQSLQIGGTFTVDSGEGDDLVFVVGSVLSSGAASFKMGAGKDLLFLPNGADHSFLKGLKIDLGAGEKSMFIGSSEFNVTGGAFSVVGIGAAGIAQNMIIAPTSGIIQGAASVSIASGNLDFELGAANKMLRFGSGLNIVAGSGNDSLTLLGTIEAAGALSVDLKDGTDGFTLDTNSQAYLGSLSIKAGGGTDFILLNPGSILTTIGSINVDLGAGAINSFQAVGTSNLTVGGGMNLVGGDGVDIVYFSGVARVAGAVSVDLKDGNNQVAVSSSLTVGSLAIKSGVGDDSVTIGQNSLLQISGLIAMTLGAGNNSFTGSTNSALVAGSFSYTGGLGDDTFTFGGSVLSSLGATTWNPGAGINTLTIEPTGYTFLGGAVKINGGSGADVVSLKGPDVRVVGTLIFALGDGNNQTTIESPVMNVGSSLSYTGGAGADTFNIGAGKLYVAGAVNIKPGNGTNNITLGATSGGIGSLSLTGGSGADTFQVGASNVTTRITVAGGLTAMAGTGANGLSLYATVVEGATLFKSTASTSQLDGVLLMGSTFNGATTISTGSGVSNVFVNDSLFRDSFQLDTGDGNDSVRLDTANNTSTVNHWFGKVTINTGAGDDTFHLGANPMSATKGNVFFKQVILNGGAGVDSVAVDTGNTYVVPLQQVAIP